MPKVERTPSGKYRIRFNDPFGKRIVVTKPTAADVRAAYKKTIGDMSRGEYADPRKGRITLTDWCAEWLAGARNLGPGGRETYERDLERYILPSPLGKMRLGSIEASHIDAYLNGLTLASSSANRHYRTLHRCFAVAVERGRLAKNPCDPVEPPKITEREPVALSVEQVEQLAEAMTRPDPWKRGWPMDSRWRAWVYVVAYGELRFSEARGLRRARVDGSTVHIVEQLVRRKDGTWESREPKARSRRTITLPAFAAAELHAHICAYALPGPDGLVFPTRNGTPPLASSWGTNTWHKALARAGLPPMRPHDLRHTGISLAIDAGANPKLSQLRAGHSSIGIHIDRYTHLMAGADQAVAEALDEMRAKALRGRLRAV